jgi:hypothetical protein
MPINIIITLFVALVVGGAIIMFGRTTIMQGQQELYKVGETPDGVTILNLSAAATQADVQRLAKNCALSSKGAVDVKDCYIVRGDLAGILPGLPSIHATPLDGAIVANVTFTGTPNALFISYDPRGWVAISS